MYFQSVTLAALAGFVLLPLIHAQSSSPIVLEADPSKAGASEPIPSAFVAYSIEFAFFPDYAGNLSHPNTFTNNLLNNLLSLQGTKPYLRIGGNTQDYALYNASLPTSTFGIINPARSPDYPTTLYIGPSFFESYLTLPSTRFTHGFNLGLGANNSAGWQTLLDTVPLACKALGEERLLWWEYGNEPDLYSTSSQGPVRPAGWNEETYVKQWLNGTRAIKSQLQRYCPDLVNQERYGYYAPSFAGANNHLKPLAAWNAGQDVDQDIKIYSIHNYIGGATSPGVTLAGTLMNHTKTVSSVNGLTAVRSLLLTNNTTPYALPPFILGETNSLYNEGAPGLSNTLGAALWGIDFNLYSASVNIKRVHMHQGTDYRYASWQPVETAKTSKGTKAPYYGNIVVAAFLGDLSRDEVRVVGLELGNSYEAAYASYVNGALAKVIVVNLRQWNYTVNGTSSLLNPEPRGQLNYQFKVPQDKGWGGWGGFARCDGGEVKVKRLSSNGSDAVTGITWDGVSYNWELDNGKPVVLKNVSTGETAKVDNNGVVGVSVLDSSAVVLEF